MKPGFFIDRPIFSAVLSIVIVLVGFIGLFLLPVGSIPANYTARRKNFGILSGGKCCHRLSGGSDPYRTGTERNARNVIHGIKQFQFGGLVYQRDL